MDGDDSGKLLARAVSEQLGGALTRRRLLRLGAMTAAAGAFAPLARPMAALARERPWPSEPLSEADALSVNAAEFMPARQLASWLRELEGMGPAGQKGLRATASPAHEQYIRQLATLLDEAGVQGLQLESVPMQRWTTESWSLEVLNGANAGPVSTASYIPYSGQTPASGVSAPLALVPTGTAPAPGSLEGKIAVFDVPIGSIPRGEFAYIEYPGSSSHAPAHKYPPTSPYRRVFLDVEGPALAAMGESGAVGMVGVIDYPPDGAYGAYYPYVGTIRGVPGIYIDRVAGAAFKQQAGEGAEARLTLPAEVVEASTNNIYGFIPGESSELVVLHSHSDGVNALEDNGPSAIVAISQYLSRLPKNALPCSVMILITGGHFHAGVGARQFRAQHQDDLVEQAKAAITLEHLGAHEWEENAEGTAMAATGKLELGIIFSPRTKALVQAAATEGREGDFPVEVLHPTNEAGTGTTYDPLWPGEGQYLYANGGMPDANFITGPSYLLNWGVDTSDRISVGRMRKQAIAFTGMLLALTRTSREELRVLNLPPSAEL